jgi:hypothetical protein
MMSMAENRSPLGYSTSAEGSDRDTAAADAEDASDI